MTGGGSFAVVGVVVVVGGGGGDGGGGGGGGGADGGGPVVFGGGWGDLTRVTGMPKVLGYRLLCQIFISLLLSSCAGCFGIII